VSLSKGLTEVVLEGLIGAGSSLPFLHVDAEDFDALVVEIIDGDVED
jgi:hypothetical protein